MQSILLPFVYSKKNNAHTTSNLLNVNILNVDVKIFLPLCHFSLKILQMLVKVQ